tara:strand:- start:233 stop:502 length:270 start_codon:yes stop_codon:yes gene_type:complete
MSQETFTICRGKLEPGQSVLAYQRQGKDFATKWEAMKFVMEDVQGYIDFYKTYGYPTDKKALEYSLYEDGFLMDTLRFRMDGKLFTELV